MNAQDHLDLIRVHVQDLQGNAFGSHNKSRRISEVRTMLWGILDRVMQIENEMAMEKARGEPDPDGA